MDHIGSINLTSHLTLNPAGTGEIRNAYVERVTTLQEEAIATTLGLPHVGRLIFNTTVGGLKQWTGGAFTPIATSLSGVTGSLNALQVAIGPIISTQFLFDPIVASQLSNIGLTESESVFDVFKAIDATIGTLKTPTAFNDLTGVKVLQPVDKQLLKYSTLESAWINDGIALTDLGEINATAAEVNHLVGTTAAVQTQINTLSDALDSVSSQLASAQSLITALNTPYTQEFTDQTTIAVTHNRNQRYVQVLVVNIADATITPVSVTYVDANNLTVMLPESATGTVIVS